MQRIQAEEMLKSSINLLHTVYAMHKTSNSLSIKQETNKNQNSQQGKVINIMDLQFINQLKDSCSYILLNVCVINALLLYLLWTFSCLWRRTHCSKQTFLRGNIWSLQDPFVSYSRAHLAASNPGQIHLLLNFLYPSASLSVLPEQREANIADVIS